MPGEQPHPTADPRGHSRGVPARFTATAPDNRRWRESVGYLFGCDLYNRGFWWEAHEAWETLWHLSGRGSAERAALQGLIQLANCHLKLHMGRVNAVRRLQRSYGGHFDRVDRLAGSPFMGIDLDRFRAGADAYIAAVTTRARPAHDPGRYPYLNLPVDR